MVTTKQDPEATKDTPVKPPKALPVLTLPSGAKILHTKCKEVKDITPAVRELAQALENYLKAHQQDNPRPVGIAAPQLGRSVQMFSYVVDDSGAVLTILNPKLVYEKKRHLVKETCLSLPGRAYMLKRGKVVKIRGMLIDGSTRSFKGHGLTAQEFLHELNHLDGVTIDSLGTGG